MIKRNKNTIVHYCQCPGCGKDYSVVYINRRLIDTFEDQFECHTSECKNQMSIMYSQLISNGKNDWIRGIIEPPMRTQNAIIK